MNYRDKEYLSPTELAQVAQIACLLEVSVPKPGNVSPERDFGDMCFEDFLFSASAIGETVKSCENMTTGEAILAAIEDTQKYVECNTNLGIVLLIIPLTRAYYSLKNRYSDEQFSTREKILKLRKEIKNLLANLSVEDADYAYQAIRLAQAGGMGQVETGDIQKAPDITLKEAMRLSQRRDNIAREYVTDFEIIFNIGYPTFEDSFNKLNLRKSILETFITILAHIPDSLIARKTSEEESREITMRAQKILSNGSVSTQKGLEMIRDLDKDISQQDNLYNPGTTADLTTGVIYTYILIRGLKFFDKVNTSCDKRGILYEQF